MVIEVGQALPEATVLRMDAEGRPEQVSIRALAGSGKAVVFGLPGAFTGTCSSAHVPSFIRSMDRFVEKGVETVVCLAVNDPWVMAAWGKETGAAEAGIVMAADAGGEFTRAIGMEFDAPPVGFHGRSKRYSMYLEDGVVKRFNPEEGRGVCELSAGETLLEQI